MIIITIIFFILAVLAYTISQLHIHQKLKWQTRSGFWGVDSWENKYKQERDEEDPNASVFFKAPDNWYYRFFKIEYKERFPGSATIFTLFTDGYHSFQFVFKLCLSIALAGFSWWAVAWFVGFGVVFTVAYKLFSK